jgi:hypothetical protein
LIARFGVTCGAGSSVASGTGLSMGMIGSGSTNGFVLGLGPQPLPSSLLARSLNPEIAASVPALVSRPSFSRSRRLSRARMISCRAWNAERRSRVQREP